MSDKNSEKKGKFQIFGQRKVRTAHAMIDLIHQLKKDYEVIEDMSENEKTECEERRKRLESLIIS